MLMGLLQSEHGVTMTTPVILHVCTDLMLSSTVSGISAQSGCRYVKVASIAEAADAASNCRILLFIDLSTPELELSAVRESFDARDLHDAYAYGPHVHVARLQSAKEAGIGNVVSRGQFSSSVHSIVSRFAESCDVLPGTG